MCASPAAILLCGYARQHVGDARGGERCDGVVMRKSDELQHVRVCVRILLVGYMHAVGYQNGKGRDTAHLRHIGHCQPARR